VVVYIVIYRQQWPGLEDNVALPEDAGGLDTGAADCFKLGRGLKGHGTGRAVVCGWSEGQGEPVSKDGMGSEFGLE
jgi:hypothetical protein